MAVETVSMSHCDDPHDRIDQLVDYLNTFVVSGTFSVYEEGVLVGSAFTALDFISTITTATDGGGGTADVTITGTAGAQNIYDEFAVSNSGGGAASGGPCLATTTSESMTFIAGPYISLTATNTAGADTILLELTGPPLFKTINCPTGTDPVATSITDTLNFTASGGATVVGTGSNTVNFGIDSTVIFPNGTEPLTVMRALVNDATGVASTDATFAFDTGTVAGGVGTATTSGTCNNCSQPFVDNEPIMLIGDGSTWQAIKIGQNAILAQVAKATGVFRGDTTFDIDNATAICGTAPSGTVTAVNTTIVGQYAENQWLPFVQTNANQWRVMLDYDKAIFKVTTEIEARSGTYTWGIGGGTLLAKTGVTTHSVTGGQTAVSIYNTTTQEIAVDRIIQCKKIDGEWFVDVDDCE